ncbi:MAG: cysteine desulfurase [Gemmatimonadetes bacterium]|nr:cysteine desulfurase [Gemmatimonadota bacterium]
MERIYLDHNATTPVDRDVAAVVAKTLTEHAGNPSSAHASGRAAKACLEQARADIAGVLSCKPSEIRFTSTGSEADNLAVYGLAVARGGRIVTSNVEHPAIARPCRAAGASLVQLDEIAVDRSGRVTKESVASALDREGAPAPALVTLIHAQNETGILQPVHEIGALCRENDVPFHTDAAQSFGKIPIDLSRDPFDLMTIVGHKFYAPKGVSVLYVRSGIELRPVILGGAQEGGMRPGTENVALAAGLALAMKKAADHLPTESPRLRQVRDAFEAGLLDQVGGVHVIGRDVDRLPGTSCVLFEDVIGFQLGAALDARGYEVSTGSACHSGSPEPSPALVAMGIDPLLAAGMVRVGFGHANTPEHAKRLVNVVAESVKQLRATGAPREVNR